MNYLYQNKKRNRQRFLPLIVVILFLTLVLLVLWIAPVFWGGVAHGIGLPFWKGQGFLSQEMSYLTAFAHSRAALIDKNRELETQLADAQTKLLALSIIEQENKELKASWGRGEDTPGTLAAVLVKPPQSLYDTLILDTGTVHGVEIGNRAMVGDTIALGVIDQVFEKSSRVNLFSSVDTETNAMIDRTGVSVLLIGTGGGNFELRVPQEFDVTKGDIVTLPGITPTIVATVLEIESVPTNSFKRVFCKIPININELRLVSVVE